MFLMLWIDFIIYIIKCLKFHVFVFAMPIAQIIIFLQFEMCHSCVNIFLPNIFSHGMYRLNNEIFTLAF
jgi:hypothetical protein